MIANGKKTGSRILLPQHLILKTREAHFNIYRFIHKSFQGV